MLNQHHSKQRRVVVSGMGVIAPNGLNLESFWRNNLAGKSGVSNVSQFDVSEFDAQIAGIVENFVPSEFGLNKTQIESLDRYAQFALAATNMAVEDAGLTDNNVDNERLGICIATAIAGTKFMEEEFLRQTDNGKTPFSLKQVSRNLLSGACFHTATSEIAKTLNACGPQQTLATGCTAGLDAIGHAFNTIRAGLADVMISGASEAPLTPIAFGAFDIIGALTSDSNDNPEAASRPYDTSRSGFVLGESCGIFVLEELSHALARNAPIYAELKGFGSTCNAYHMTNLQPEGHDLHRAMVAALQDAQLSPDKIDHVNAHGSSTPQNDVNETNALKKTLGNHAYNIPVCSSKSQIGHALAAANAVETIAAILALKHQQVPPTINMQKPDPQCDLNYVANQAQAHKIENVLKDASGFSGIHSALVFGKCDTQSLGENHG
ncbi:beta-ketoacyl-[acyl-carrier-protein] synthase family protein [Pseudoalteromonas luteoviolacea]|uniref:Ketosynthase family 3 (KS3) domain-containing protein n=1 Tax=Pseudoalteromonas luteoviolacea S4060-1 TaxID=1365257 RepID=A0A162BLK0_9GAMM|nr:beta-ketoacyl-[acyl-carrier-protein] synthase family protein [Pseudoalteromonas luteoviolacea]KZN63884.1 hypothetical protein N478_23335 [Pseudoalteromonas luteoviolacea S4060-1]